MATQGIQVQHRVLRRRLPAVPAVCVQTSWGMYVRGVWEWYLQMGSVLCIPEMEQRVGRHAELNRVPHHHPN